MSGTDPQDTAPDADGVEEKGVEERGAEGPRGWFSTAVPALTFLVGLALGGALIYAFSGGEATSPAAEPAPSPTTSAQPNDTVVTVPAACEEASQGIGEAYGLLRQAVDQVRDFQAQELVDTIDELQTVDEETRPLVDRCTEVSVTTEPTPEDGTATPE